MTPRMRWIALAAATLLGAAAAGWRARPPTARDAAPAGAPALAPPRRRPIVRVPRRRRSRPRPHMRRRAGRSRKRCRP
ncbi:hypothetical protein UKMH10_3807 [Burkholderia pseudomallei]|nr:hypothetical protein UKMH10_3807 [Burkholderia pseudomallei]